MSQYRMPFDCETGGTDERKTDLLTVYACIMDEDYKIIEELDLKLKPDNDRLPICEAGALAVNKIDVKKHLEDPETVTYSEGRKKLIAMVKKYAAKRGRFSNMTPFGFNVPFDKRYVQQYLITKEEWEDLFHYKDEDVDQAVSFLRRVGWIPKDVARLQDVADYLGVPKRLAHNAKEDVLRTIDTDKKLVELMNSKKEGGSTQDLISLLEAE
jgi:oligoribonuclease (3'-5' exoribonuclease)